jgi:CRP/FNR family transcriptional regulator, cyclic AMP receptor protein
MTAGEIVRMVAACFGCGEDAARHLCQAMTQRAFTHRAPIAHSGDPALQLYLVIDGAVAAEIFGIEGQQAQLSRYGPGEIFGAYPRPATHRADMTAIGKTQLLSIPTETLADMACRDAEIGAGLANLLAGQLDLVLDRMAARIGLSATGRFHRALIQLADDDGLIRPAPIIAALALTVHTTRETASRALAALVRRGIVERQDDALRIVSRQMLEEMIV